MSGHDGLEIDDLWGMDDDDRERMLRQDILFCLEREMRLVLHAHRWIPKSCLKACPGLILRDGMSEWGCCFRNGMGYRIALDSRLVLEHPWYAVKEVLLHELAHFLTMSLYPGLAEGPHGETFRRICKRLGGNVKASGSYQPLDMTMLLDEGSEESQKSPMELKVAKLLALAKSPNEHEAHLALCKARELMARYGVSEATNDSDPFVSVDIVLKGTRMQREEAELMSILDRYYSVRCLIDEGYARVNGELCKRRVVSVSGRRSKVKVALYVRDYIWHLVDEWWRRHGGGVRVRRDYALGFLAGMLEALQRQEAGDAEEWGLVRREEAGLDDYFHARYPRIRRTFASGIHVDSEVNQEGRVAGSQLKIRPGIESESPEAGPRLLGE